MEYYRPEPIEPEQKDRTLLRVLLMGCGLLFLIGIGAALLFGKFFNFARAPAKVVQSHLAAINEGNLGFAYSYFSKAFQGGTSLEDFRSQIDSFSSLLPYQDMNLNRVEIVNDKAVIEGTMTGNDGAVFPVRYELIKEQGEWKIETYEWTSPGERQTI